MGRLENWQRSFIENQQLKQKFDWNFRFSCEITRKLIFVTSMLRNFTPGSPDNASIALPPNATGWWQHEEEKIYPQFEQATLHNADTAHCLRRNTAG